MKYLKLSIPAGIKWQGTAYQCSDRWHDGSLVRWDQGAMLPIGGWVPYLNASYSRVTIPDDMVARDAHSWFLNQDAGASGSGYYLAVATPLRLYVMDGEGDVKELTEGLTLQGSETSFLSKGYGGGKKDSGDHCLVQPANKNLGCFLLEVWAGSYVCKKNKR